MRRILQLGVAMLGVVALEAIGQAGTYRTVDNDMLLNPDPSDWLMINRTYDQQRFSPLDQVNATNVNGLQLAWARGLPLGSQETVPLVHDGVLYVVQPGASVLAVDATTGDELWVYYRDISTDVTQHIGRPELSRTKNIGIYGDVIIYPAPDGFLVGLDARTGELRWETEVFDPATRTQHTGGVLIADGKAITNRTCARRVGCFIAAHDALTGEELWKFYNTAAEGTPDGDTWGGLPEEQRAASSWGLPGSYDPERRITYWGIANPSPYTRLTRHGSADAISNTAPSNLYSNSTVALDIDTGELVWYYQHSPGDDWDLDHLHERTLVTTRIEPDPGAVKWINPGAARGEDRDTVVAVGEGGGIWMLDRTTGQFLWAMPFPYDIPEFHIANINVETGRTEINSERLFIQDGDRRLVCYHNTRSFWSTAYDPDKNSLYIPYHDACLDMTANSQAASGYGPRNGILRPGIDPNEYANIAKVNLATGEMERIYSQAEPGNGSALVTAGNLLFWGDMARRFRAFDSDSGEILWETVLGGIAQTSTITYAVDGRQYVLVMTGNAQSGTATPMAISRISTVQGHNAIYAFALPD